MTPAMASRLLTVFGNAASVRVADASGGHSQRDAPPFTTSICPPTCPPATREGKGGT